MEVPKSADVKPLRRYCIPLEAPSFVSILVEVAARRIILAKGKSRGLTASIFGQERGGEGGGKNKDNRKV